MSETSIDLARTGRYPASAVSHLDERRLRAYFIQEGGSYRVAREVRDLCVFARQDLISDSPFSRLDLVSCRNVLIYLDAAAQRRIMHLMHYAIKRDWYLMLSPSEGVGSELDLFEIADKKSRIYRRLSNSRSPVDLDAYRPLLTVGKKMKGKPEVVLSVTESVQREAQRVILARYSPAGLLIDDALDILEFHGAISVYLEHPPGVPSVHITRMVRPQLVIEITPAIEEVRRTGAPVRRSGLAIPGDSNVTFEVIPLKNGSPRACYLILFDAGVTASHRHLEQASALAAMPESEKDRQLTQLTREAAATRAYLQAAMEDHEAIKEALKTANEEIVSSNEEFKSTNEELETAKEELQSTNEELTTINDELRHRIQELDQLNESLRTAQAQSERARASTDTLVETVRVPLLVLDADLQILRANSAFYRLFNLSASQTIGNHLHHMHALSWSTQHLMERLRQVLQNDVTLERYDIIVDSAGNKLRMHVNGRKIAGSSERAEAILMAFEPWGVGE